MYRFIGPAKLGLIIILASIMFFNGCTIRSPAPTMPSPPSTEAPSITYPPETTATYHTVQRGETLSIIAEMYGISSYRDLATWNGISPPYIISPGDRLLVTAPQGYIPAPVITQPVYTPPPVTQIPVPSSPPTQTAPKPVVRSGGDYHTVQRGETLYRIAQAYGRNMAELAAWNHLSYPYPLSVGQSLRVTPPTTDTVASTPTYSTPTLTPSIPSTTSSRYHTVQKGDTLYNIAHRYQQEVADIAQWNDLQPPYSLSLNQQLLVKPPGSDEGNYVQTNATASVAAPSENRGNVLYHSISAGETLYRISKMYGYSVEEVAAWNGLRPPYNNLKVGQSLQVSPSNQKVMTSSPRNNNTVSVSIPDGVIQHIVKNGETVYSIAQRYGITAFDLAIWNGIGKPYTIFPGQKLKIVK